jgi:hypothetical protein
VWGFGFDPVGDNVEVEDKEGLPQKAQEPVPEVQILLLASGFRGWTSDVVRLDWLAPPPTAGGLRVEG